MDSNLSFILISLALIISLSHAQFTFPVKHAKNITFAFGSCTEISQDVSGRIFKQVIKQEPDIWTWIGDAIYIESNDESDIVDLYQRTLRSPGYSELRSRMPIIGIWDDHDMGPDNGGKFYSYKERNRQLFLQFIGEPLNSMRWHLEGLYTSYYIGEKQQVKIILLDTRYNKDVRMSFNSSGEFLDEAQWAWLEAQLTGDDAKWTMITSGVQVFPDDRLYPETWFTNSKQRLLSIIRKTKRSGVILLSGDVHYAELMEYPCPQRVGYHLTEMTSSGLTHYLEDMEPLINGVYPETYSTRNDRYFGKNFGIIRFIFEDEPTAILEIWNHRGSKVLEKIIPYSQVTFNQSIIDMEAECAEDVGKISRFMRFLFVSYSRGESVAIAVILVGFTLGLAIILCWAAIIFYRIDKRRGKEFKNKDNKSYIAMKYKYKSV